MDRNTPRPRPSLSVQQPASQQPSAPAYITPPRSARARWIYVVGGVVVLAGLVYGAMMLWPSARQSVATDRYQAVFLDNGQVFFGKLKNTDGSYLRLEKAYYTKKQDLPTDATEEQKAAVANNVSLVKVGDEVYGPENVMMVRSEQILFWQNLSADSKVAKAIDSAKN